MIEKLDINKIPAFLENSSSRQPNSTAAFQVGDADVSVQVDYARFIDMAIKTPQPDTLTVQQAKELLLSGQLESSENIKQAARNIVTYGI